jgi:hypothetical protein
VKLDVSLARLGKPDGAHFFTLGNSKFLRLVPRAALGKGLAQPRGIAMMGSEARKDSCPRAEGRAWLSSVIREDIPDEQTPGWDFSVCD